ncbi:hypothetical protein ASPBRDRAFT_195913 [Aspergillus brasiliensis CBS 101740]|uniref:Acyl-CoA dehydrogenase/oxidase N-terminal domain-containing protein n=1 Tax=Aspergillus brasiliensis (strain CBS 101740 / IMI 381727 / IBT 21946) TaxID=767769 RepID=A0A1L9UJE1_ASPBC|nr:hypothetical protein ASPBRDRAFT_195913 [Aspergillus brasiliensis CBS 101740]
MVTHGDGIFTTIYSSGIAGGRPHVTLCLLQSLQSCVISFGTANAAEDAPFVRDVSYTPQCSTPTLSKLVQLELTFLQKAIKARASTISQEILSPAYANYSTHTNQLSRFRATRPYYTKLVQTGILKSLIPKSAGGTCEKWMDSGLIVEEVHSIDASLSIHLVGTVLGLLPLILGGTTEQKEKFLAPFLTGKEDHLASLTHSEPGGTANHLEKGGRGLAVTARKEGDFYIVNGEKLWTTNSAGWDGQGATLSCLVARSSEDGGPEKPENTPEDNIMVLLVTRDIVAQNPPEAYAMLSEPNLMGHIAVTGPHTRYTNFRIPTDHVLFHPGQAAPIIEKSFGITGAIVGAMAAGTMRTAFELAIDFARRDNRGGTVPIIERQSVADLIIDVKVKIDSARTVLLAH